MFYNIYIYSEDFSNKQKSVGTIIIVSLQITITKHIINKDIEITVLFIFKLVYFTFYSSAFTSLYIQCHIIHF